ncbi:hypothetical protein WN943_011078 [Citrus x changshan-huyou]
MILKPKLPPPAVVIIMSEGKRFRPVHQQHPRGSARKKNREEEEKAEKVWRNILQILWKTPEDAINENFELELMRVEKVKLKWGNQRLSSELEAASIENENINKRKKPRWDH